MISSKRLNNNKGMSGSNNPSSRKVEVLNEHFNRNILFTQKIIMTLG